MKLTKEELETLFNYNQADENCVCETADPVMIRKLNKLCEKSNLIFLKNSTENFNTYIFPKKWIRVKMPKEIGEEKRSEMARIARERFGIKKGSDESNG